MNTDQPQYSAGQQIATECFGTMLLLCTVIGSGIMAQRLAQGNMAVALLGNTLATVWMLYVLIELLGPISGAHFNPLVTLIAGQQTLPIKAGYIAAQCVGAVCGAWLAHGMFELPVLQWSTTERSGWGQWLAEVLATACLLCVVLRTSAHKAASHVACFIGAAYWFTASTSFANPAAVLGRMLSDSFAGIAPGSALGFVAAQCVGAALAVGLNRQLAVCNTPNKTDL
jgi:glycerol uptake facilitator-like aquaporin